MSTSALSARTEEAETEREREARFARSWKAGVVHPTHPTVSKIKLKHAPPQKKTLIILRCSLWMHLAHLATLLGDPKYCCCCCCCCCWTWVQWSTHNCPATATLVWTPSPHLADMRPAPGWGRRQEDSQL